MPPANTTDPDTIYHIYLMTTTPPQTSSRTNPVSDVTLPLPSTTPALPKAGSSTLAKDGDATHLPEPSKQLSSSTPQSTSAGALGQAFEDESGPSVSKSFLRRTTNSTTRSTSSSSMPLDPAVQSRPTANNALSISSTSKYVPTKTKVSDLTRVITNMASEVWTTSDSVSASRAVAATFKPVQELMTSAASSASSTTQTLSTTLSIQSVRAAKSTTVSVTSAAAHVSTPAPPCKSLLSRPRFMLFTYIAFCCSSLFAICRHEHRGTGMDFDAHRACDCGMDLV